MSDTPRNKRPARKPAVPSRPALEATIERFDDDGIGCTRFKDQELQIPGAFPGEKVAFRLDYQGQRRSGGRLVKVLTPSPDRIVSACKQELACLGCPLISLSYEAQLRSKQAKVTDAFAAYDSLRAAHIDEILAAEHPLGYRTNAKLSFRKVRGKVQIGIYRRGSHEVVDLANCPLHHPLINRIMAVLREEVERQVVWVYDEQRRRGLLRYLLIRVCPTSNEAMVTFVTTERDFSQITHLAKWLVRKVPEVVSVQQNVNASQGNVIVGRETIKMLGFPTLRDRVDEVELVLSPSSFFQVNHEQAAKIYALVRRWAGLKPEEAALDLYCGIGGIALNLARDAGKVIGIEVVEEAVHNARENAKRNGRSNCRFIAGDVAELLEGIAGDLPPRSVATINPPRKGCDAAVLDALCELPLRTLIYVSCNPESLARDLDRLCRNGWRVEAVQPVDMFPQTPHVETVVRLRRQ